jgi:HEAT repeats
VRPLRFSPLTRRSIALLTGLLMGGAIGAEPGNRTALSAEGEQLSVAMEDGIVTIEAREVPLAEVLRAIGEQAGIVVMVEGGDGDRISRSLSDVSVSEAIRLLLGDVPSAVTYKTLSGQLAEIHVRLVARQAAARAPDASGTGSVDSSDPEAPLEDPEITPDDPHDHRLAFVRKAARAPQADALDALSALVLEDDDPLIRGSAAAALGKLSGAGAREALGAALADRDHRVRRRVARVLGEQGGEFAVDALSRVLMEERVPKVRRMAAWALSRMGDEAALSALEMARHDLDPTVRNIAEAARTHFED